MNAKKAKALRKQARQYTQHLPERTYDGNRLGECTRGAYKALKSARFTDRRQSATMQITDCQPQGPADVAVQP